MSVEALLRQEDLPAIKAHVEAILATVPDNATTIPALSSILDYCATTPTDFAMKLSEWFVTIFQRSRFPFADEQITVREIAADHYEQNERYPEMLRVLNSIPSENGMRSAKPTYRFTLLTRVILTKQKIGDWQMADADLAKAIPLFRRLSPDDHRKFKDSVVQFLACHARQLDKRSKFIDAAHKFYEAFQKDEALTWALENAVVCALLGDVGVPRTRILQKLHSDPHLKSLALAQIVDRAVHARRIRVDDAQTLEKYLQSHHKVASSSGVGGTVAQVAIASHNMHAASKVYQDISLKDLAALLGIATAREVEAIASQLIVSGAINASIDEVHGVVQFSSATGEAGSDRRATKICEALEAIATEVQSRFPVRSSSSSLAVAEESRV